LSKTEEGGGGRAPTDADLQPADTNSMFLKEEMSVVRVAGDRGMEKVTK
jgi:hypothetical protein